MYLQMGSLSVCLSGMERLVPFVTHKPLYYVSVNDERVCFQGDRGPKGACGGDGPKGGKVGFRQAENILQEEEEKKK